jgi:hypothetical protein
MENANEVSVCACGHPLHDSGRCAGTGMEVLPPEDPRGSIAVRCACVHSRLSGEMSTAKKEGRQERRACAHGHMTCQWCAWTDGHDDRVRKAVPSDITRSVAAFTGMAIGAQLSHAVIMAEMERDAISALQGACPEIRVRAMAAYCHTCGEATAKCTCEATRK